MTSGRRTLRQRLGDAAERQAERHLVAAGLVLEARNWRCRLGELDLVMRDGPTLVFVEVRRRRRSAFGSAADSIGPRKRARLRRAAELYLQQRRSLPPCRFDVVALDEDADGGVAFDWIRNAFDARYS